MNFTQSTNQYPHNPQKSQPVVVDHADAIKGRLQDLMMHMPANKLILSVAGICALLAMLEDDF